MTGRVVVIGDALIDELVDKHGTTRHPGGSALNVAVDLAILGVPTTLVTAIGDDADGELLRATLADHGVGLAAAVSPLGTGLARSERRNGEPTYTFNEAMLRRAIPYTPEQRAAVAAADVVAVSGYPFDDPVQVEGLTDLVGGLTGSFAVDPNPRPALLQSRSAFRLNLEELAPRIDLLKVGDDDLELLYGADAVGDHRFRELCRVVLYTRGSAGAELWDGDRTLRAAAEVSAADVVDTMGAGDATFAALLAELATAGLESAEWDAALRRAMGLAAATVRKPGALIPRL